MTNATSKLSGVPLESLIGTAIALVIVALVIALVIRKYWGSRKPVATRKPTLFDVRDLLARNEKPKAIKVYRQIFKVDLKEAQQAVEALEKNMHQQG